MNPPEHEDEREHTNDDEICYPPSEGPECPACDGGHTERIGNSELQGCDSCGYVYEP
jgi:ribosomal protein L37AE/L43A